MESNLGETGTAPLSVLCQRNGLMLEKDQLESLTQFARLLKEWNQKVNLVSRKDEENIWRSHILHSLSLLFFFEIPRSLSVLDLGTGGGLPGIPLAIARPDLHFTLVDSIRKKTTAVQDMISRLPVGNVTVVTSRGEDLGKSKSMRFDIILTRAVASLPDLLNWTRGLYSKEPRGGGTLVNRKTGEHLRTPLLIAWKGGDLTDELRQARIRFPRTRLSEIPLLFEGIAGTGLEDKRLVVAEPRTDL